MNFRTIEARYPGKCRRCEQAIEVGQRIRYGGRGQTYHLAAECPVQRVETPAQEAERINAEWAEQKNRFAEVEAAQERAAFEAKAQRDDVLAHYMRRPAPDQEPAGDWQ